MQAKTKKLESLNIAFDTKLEFERMVAAMKEEKRGRVTHDEAVLNLMAGYKALERERLTKSAPILGNSDYNSLTDDKNSVIISVRPEEKEPVERLVAILRAGGDFAARLQQELSLLFRKIGGGADVGEVRSEGKAADGRLGSATPVRRVVAKSLREGTHKDAKSEHPI